MAVNVKLGVDLGDFNSGIKSAKEQIKTFDAALKYAEASLKSTGDAESALTTKTEALRGKLEAQKKVVDQYTDALQKMNAAGVEKTSSSYQKMQTNLLNAKAAMETTRAQINDLNTSQTNAAKSADDLATNVGKIGKNVSLQTLSDGLSKLNNSLERGARTAIRMGRTIARSAMSSTGWADDLSTRSTQYGIDVETLQRMENVAAYIDTDVDAIISARDRMSKNRESLEELLGISTDGRSVDDVFWEAGEAIMKLGEGFDQNEYAMKIFGRGWRELLPLFTAGREEYEALMKSQSVLSKEQIDNLVKGDDAFKQVQQQAQLLINQFWADNAGKITDLLQWIIDNKDGVVAAITAIGGAFAALKLGEVALDIAKVVRGFQGLTGGGKGGTPAPTTGTPTVLPTGGVTGGGTTLVSGSGGLFNIGTKIADFATSKTGAIAIGALMLTPIISKIANGTLIEDPAKVAGIDANTADLFNRALNGGKVPIGGGASAQNMVKALTGGEKVEVPVEAKTEGDEAAKIAAQIGAVTVPVNLRVNMGAGAFAGGGGGGGQADYFMDSLFGSFRPGFANGLPFVNHTQLALLHRGERVLTATQNQHYTYNSNTYFGSVNLNNGMQIDALTESIARQNRRQRAAYGA